MNEVSIAYPTKEDETQFLHAMQTSKDLHHPWISPPSSTEQFSEYLLKYANKNNISYFLWCGSDIVGVVNLNEIVRGCFQSAYLGYYCVAKYAGRGYMSKGFSLVLEAAFTKHRLHRLEANIQPDNVHSINLVKRHGFRQEGFSPRYLHINGAWQDHQRWALTMEDWQTQH